MVPYQKEEEIMGEDSGSRGSPLNTMTGDEGSRIITASIEDLIYDESAADEEIVPALAESVGSSIQINPIIVTPRIGESGTTQYLVVRGVQRVVAHKRLGKPTIRCTLLMFEDPLLLEQLSIDEDLIRRNLSAAERAMRFGQRSENEKKRAERDGTLSQNATASKQAMRAAGLETGSDIGSRRDQAKKTGESKDMVHRSMKRFESLGPTVLKSIVGTSLDKGVELDALAMLPEHVQGKLIKRATLGEEVSATRALRRAQSEPQHHPPVSEREHAENAVREFYDLIEKYTDLLASKDLLEQINQFYSALYNDVYSSDKNDDSEETSGPPKKRSWLDRLRRKGD
jgi:hypothetical protein